MIVSAWNASYQTSSPLQQQQPLAILRFHCYREHMENPQLTTLRSLVLQAKHNLESLEIEDPRVVRSRELLDAAVVLVEDVIATPAAAVIGAKGGKATAKRMAKKDPQYYARIAGMRKKRAGGRPKKKAG